METKAKEGLASIETMAKDAVAKVEDAIRK